MSGSTTKKMLSLYSERRPPTMFLTRFFRITADSFFESETVEFDIMRSEEDVAIAVTDLASGNRLSEATQYTNKEITPPIYKEAFPVNAHKLIEREPGQDPFASPVYQANALRRFASESRRVEAKVLRAIEWQASQTLTTGTVTLVDADGNDVYAIDWKPKSTHFFDAGTAWDDSADVDIIGDIQTLADLCRTDGKADPRHLIMGTTSFRTCIETNTAFKNKFESRRADLGSLAAPQLMNSGGIYHGSVTLGSYEYLLWTYEGRYKHPETGDVTKFIPDDKVVMLPDIPDFQALFGSIPRLAPPEARVLPYLPSQVRDVEGVRLHWYAWLNDDATGLTGSVATRPILLPRAIDTFGCISTGV